MLLPVFQFLIRRNQNFLMFKMMNIVILGTWWQWPKPILNLPESAQKNSTLVDNIDNKLDHRVCLQNTESEEVGLIRSHKTCLVPISEQEEGEINRTNEDLKTGKLQKKQSILFGMWPEVSWKVIIHLILRRRKYLCYHDVSKWRKTWLDSVSRRFVSRRCWFSNLIIVPII